MQRHATDWLLGPASRIRLDQIACKGAVYSDSAVSVIEYINLLYGTDT